MEASQPRNSNDGDDGEGRASETEPMPFRSLYRSHDLFVCLCLFLLRLLGFSMIFVLRAFALDLLLSALSFYTCRLSLHEGFPSLEIRNPDIRKTRTQNIMNTHLVGDPVLLRSRPRLFLVPRSRYAGRRSKSVAPPRARWSPSVPLESGDIASHGARRRPMVGHTIRRCQFGRVSERGCNIRRSKRPEAP